MPCMYFLPMTPMTGPRTRTVQPGEHKVKLTKKGYSDVNLSAARHVFRGFHIRNVVVLGMNVENRPKEIVLLPLA